MHAKMHVITTAELIAYLVITSYSVHVKFVNFYIEALYIASYFSATPSHQGPARRSKSVVQGVTIFTIHKLNNLIHMIQLNLNLTITCMG